MKKFAVFDIDGTLFRWQLFHEVVFELIASGYIPKEAQVKIDEKMTLWRNRAHRHAFSDYEHAVIEAFLPHLPGLKVANLEAAADKVLERSGAKVHAYTRNLIEKLRAQGYFLIAISGSQDEVVKRFAKLWQFDMAIGQVHEVSDGVYTGKIPGKLLITQKGPLLKSIVTENKLSWEDSIAIGDSRSDSDMLELVEHPIAFNPDDQLFAVAQTKGWKVVIERKNMIYELEQRDGTYVLAQANPR
jgi:HAD superfamily hydrolase (TIGR01490 family)